MSSELHHEQDNRLDLRHVRIAIAGDFDSTFLPHTRTNEALSEISEQAVGEFGGVWIPTCDLESGAEKLLASYDGLLIAPGSPYVSLLGALNAITYARTSGTPLLGTCGGCQHVIIEFARRVLGIPDAAHAEYDPYASTLFIDVLACSLVGRSLQVTLLTDAVRDYYGTSRAIEQFYCNFGLASAYEAPLNRGGLITVGRDDGGEARIFSLESHPFYYATVFVPQLTSSRDKPHPLIVGFLQNAAEVARRGSYKIDRQ